MLKQHEVDKINAILDKAARREASKLVADTEINWDVLPKNTTSATLGFSYYDTNGNLIATKHIATYQRPSSWDNYQDGGW